MMMMIRLRYTALYKFVFDLIWFDFINSFASQFRPTDVCCRRDIQLSSFVIECVSLVLLDHVAAIARCTYCYWRSTLVCLCVCLSVDHVWEPCKNGWTDRDAVWLGDSRKPNDLDGVQIRPREWAFLGGCPAHWKALGVSAVVYAAKATIQFLLTARRAMRPFVKILWPPDSVGRCCVRAWPNSIRLVEGL